jgi:glycerophosphoryl diester phosphodiesterase
LKLDGIGPEKDQLIINTSLPIEASDLYKNAKEFGLFIHAYTFRIDSLPKYVSSYNELLDIFVNKLKLDGLFTDFPDLTRNYILKNSIPKLNKSWILQMIAFFVILIKLN